MRERLFDSRCETVYGYHMLNQNIPYQTEPFIDKKQLARHLGCTPRTVESYMSAGLIPFFKIRRSVKYRLSDVVAHMEQHYRVGGAAR
ncbi:MAG: helix-turn-helix domain-containing protein [Verrucomicrobia bacterium]|nr:helix-turn-helix domain-containing protein [Verrucomicrobiota bacterium]